MLNGLRLLPLLTVVCLIAGTFSTAALAQSFSYDRIDVIGNTRVDAATVINYSGLPLSGTVTSADLNMAFQSISRQALFQDLSIVPRDSVLEIHVVEFPIIKSITIEGNRRINEDDLTPRINSRVNYVYRPSLAEEDAARIADVYFAAGRLAATVTPKIVRREGDFVDLIFEVAEGRVTEIERIGFVGNTRYSDRRLRRVLESKQAGILRAFVSSDVYAPERLNLDKTLLTDFYRSRGFIDFEILSVSAELARERNAFFVTFNVSEGLQHRFGEITASSNVEEIDADEILEESRIRPNSVYSPAVVDDAVRRMEYFASSRDMPFVRVLPLLSRGPNETIDIDFVVERGERIVVERIEIEGNLTTLDRVIRRNFRFVEGDAFNPNEVAYAAARIRALGYFSEVEVTDVDLPGNRKILNVGVEEVPTGSLSFGIAYGERAGPAVSVSITERNLLGRGQTLSFSLETGRTDRSYFIRFVDPSVFDRELALGLSLGRLNVARTDRIVNTTETQLGAFVGFPLSETSRLRLTGEIATLDATTYLGPSEILREEVGPDSVARGFGGTVGYQYDFNNIRSGAYLDRGFVAQLKQEVGVNKHSHGVLRTTARLGAQTTTFGEEVTLTGVVEAGAAVATQGGPTLLDRFQMDNDLMRGFAPFGMGPRSPATRRALGGNYFAVTRLEGRFPLGAVTDAGLEGGVFFDVGTLWGLSRTQDYTPLNLVADDSLKWRAATGVSLFWATPIGALRFNLSRPVKTQPGDIPQSFEFALDSQF
ncbi:MAG: outer membrane protein assembly factor BamA [Rhodobacteraceae bacterium]|nr:outer membrane protein assembly factor BamA [Paracoccaceae bacterium]